MPDDNVSQKFCPSSLMFDSYDGEVSITVACEGDPGHYATHAGVCISDSKTYAWDDMIGVVGHLRDEGGVYARCTCGWAHGPSKHLMELGKAAVGHSQETGHILRTHE